MKLKWGLSIQPSFYFSSLVNLESTVCYHGCYGRTGMLTLEPTAQESHFWFHKSKSRATLFPGNEVESLEPILDPFIFQS